MRKPYGETGDLVLARPPLVAEDGEAWWEDFGFSPIAKLGTRREYLQALVALPQGLLFPLGGRFETHWAYLTYRKANGGGSTASWVPLQDPAHTGPLWFVPEVAGPGGRGAVPAVFLAPLDKACKSGPNVGYVWLRELSAGVRDGEFLYAGRLWLRTLRPIPVGAFCRADVAGAFSYYSWSPAAYELSVVHEGQFNEGLAEPTSWGAPVHGFDNLSLYGSFEHTKVCGGAPVRHDWVAGQPPRVGSLPPVPPPVDVLREKKGRPVASSSDVQVRGHVVPSVAVRGGVEGGISRSEAFSAAGDLDARLLDHRINFIEDGSPLPFAELLGWWRAEVTRCLDLRAQTGAPAYSVAVLAAIRARTHRYRRWAVQPKVKKVPGQPGTPALVTREMDETPEGPGGDGGGDRGPEQVKRRRTRRREERTCSSSGAEGEESSGSGGVEVIPAPPAVAGVPVSRLSDGELREFLFALRDGLSGLHGVVSDLARRLE